MRVRNSSSWLAAGVMGVLLIGCQSGGVGDPCTPEDEYQANFSGFDKGEVNIESRSYQCETRVCLVNHFQGRTTCPYGQSEADLAKYPDNVDPATRVHTNPDNHRCHIPGTTETVQVVVEPQVDKRQTDTSVYCSCRCDGPDPNAKYCECPSGFQCEPLVQDLGLGSGQLAGSYCVKDGTRWTPSTVVGVKCRHGAKKGEVGYCGNPDANGAGVNP